MENTAFICIRRQPSAEKDTSNISLHEKPLTKRKKGNSAEGALFALHIPL
jgi:hypothetical protein